MPKRYALHEDAFGNLHEVVVAKAGDRWRWYDYPVDVPTRAVLGAPQLVALGGQHTPDRRHYHGQFQRDRKHRGTGQ